MSREKEDDESAQSLRKAMIEDLSIRASESKRDTPVTTRLDDEIIDMLDILVKLGIFKSRSEAIASILESILLEHRDKFTQLETEIKKLERIQDRAKDIAIDVLQRKSS